MLAQRMYAEALDALGIEGERRARMLEDHAHAMLVHAISMMPDGRVLEEYQDALIRVDAVLMHRPYEPELAACRTMVLEALSLVEAEELDFPLTEEAS